MNEKPTTPNTVKDEESFYDHDYFTSPGKSGFEKWLISLQPALPKATEKILEALGQIKDRRICEIGCGTGILTRELALKGAIISAVDISSEELKIAQERNREFIPELVSFHKGDVCSLDFEDESFDLVAGISILHHVDQSRISREIHRILKPGGRAVFTEPLGHNPISNLWRKFTPSIRTKNEWPLRYKEIEEMGNLFRVVKYREFACLTLISSLVFLFTFSKKLKNRAGDVLARWEVPVLRKCKPLRRFSGLILIEYIK
jgi:ubiquinone/menaquinone biosynthesis C-methylase UbiE